MKVVYCDGCRDISIKSRFEGDTCNRCGRAARPVPHTRPWQYYASTAVLLAATAVAVLVPIPELLVRIGILVVALGVALSFSSWSLRSMRAQILKSLREPADPEAKT